MSLFNNLKIKIQNNVWSKTEMIFKSYKSQVGVIKNGSNFIWTFIVSLATKILEKLVLFFW